MNLPNKISLWRLALAPVFAILWRITIESSRGEGFAQWTLPLYVVLVLVYLFLEISDVVDGYIARKYNLVTDLGKVLDPFSDVLSRLTGFYCFVLIGIMPPFFFLVILYRELGVTFGRMIMMKSGVAMAASIWGKIKAVFYGVGGVFGVTYLGFYLFGDSSSLMERAELIGFIVYGLAMISSVISFLFYLPPIVQALQKGDN